MNNFKVGDKVTIASDFKKATIIKVYDNGLFDVLTDTNEVRRLSSNFVLESPNDSMFRTKFSVGDSIILKSFDNKKATITSIRRIDEDGSLICDVVTENNEVLESVSSADFEVDNSKTLVVETKEDEFYQDLDEFTDNYFLKDSLNNTSNYDYDKIKEEIEVAIDEIIKELDLSPSYDEFDKLRTCAKVQKYIATKNVYNKDIMEEKKHYDDKNTRLLDLYNSVVNKSGVCSSNSIEFQEILSRIGISAEIVCLISKKGGHHMANLVLLNGEYYFFDTTLENSIYLSKNGSEDDIVLCCAGLGSEDYCKYYTPEGIVSANLYEGVKPVPDNVAKYSIPYEIVNNLVSSKSPKAKAS